MLDREWTEETESKVTSVKIHEREKKLAIDWSYRGIPSYGIAESVDGIHFKGKYATPAGAAEPDDGEFECRLYSTKAGERLLFGSWHSLKYGHEKEFTIELADNEA